MLKLNKPNNIIATVEVMPKTIQINLCDNNIMPTKVIIAGFKQFLRLKISEKVQNMLKSCQTHFQVPNIGLQQFHITYIYSSKNLKSNFNKIKVPSTKPYAFKKPLQFPSTVFNDRIGSNNKNAKSLNSTMNFK